MSARQPKFAVGESVVSRPCGSKGAFVGTVRSVHPGKGGWYYHVKDSDDGSLWHRDDADLTAHEVPVQ